MAWQFLRQDAADSVRYRSGVTGVSNQIGIQPVLSATAVKSGIKAAPKRRAAAEAKTIAVEVKGAEDQEKARSVLAQAKPAVASWNQNCARI